MEKTKYKITEAQIRKMIDFGISFDRYENQPVKDYTFYYSHLTPEDIYVKYVSYYMHNDGSIGTDTDIQCIDKEGKMRDCVDQFKTVQEKLYFFNDFVELTIDDMELVKFK